MLKQLLLPVITLMLFSLVGCSNEQKEEPAKNIVDIVEVDESEIELLRTENEILNERHQYLVTTLKQIMDNLSDEEMLALSQNQFSYDLKVNEQSIPKNGQLTISKGNITILLSEMFFGSDFLPEEWVAKGRITGNYIDHVLNFDTTNWEPLALDGTVNTAQGYELANVKAGQQFSFHITDELKKRLKLDTNLIHITVE
ncbi:hypothetical protein AAGS61_03130 [Lysinibacillus sp. KU-BSD001]|uniref:hypothetical protein n=1 Tax=Lysinibacillus sp. KU-BSD001 TaxID=3141328 RepID=UPI0036E8203F